MEISRNRFTYHPLLETLNEIRVIHLLPSTIDDEIRCIVEHVSLDEDPVPTYAALSYVWGDATIVKPISLGYQDIRSREGLHSEAFIDFQVTTNLEAALRQLRSPDHVKVLWVDAICINQQDLQERAMQVRKMGRIYSMASEVTIWLGKLLEADEADFGLQEQDMQRGWQYLCRFAEVTRSGVSEEDFYYGIDHSQRPTGPRYNALQAICSRKWFGRVWVLQEELLASSHLMIHCGPEKMEFNDFLRAVRYLVLLVHRVTPDQVGLFMPANEHRYFRREFLSPNFQDRPLGERVLKALMETSGSLDATDLRDALYGLLGIIGGKQEHNALVPNYTKSLNEFFIDLSWFLIESTQVFALLERSPPGNRPPWPSWVSSWRRGYGSAFNSFERMKNYARPSISDCKRILSTRVIPLGSVILCRVIQGNVQTDMAGWIEGIVEVENALAAVPAVSGRVSDRQGVERALAETLMKEVIISKSQLARHIKQYEIIMGRSPEPERGINQTGTPIPDINPLLAQISNLQSHGLAILALSSGHLACIVGQGHEPEIFDEPTFLGDDVFLFPGCPYQMLLRREEEKEEEEERSQNYRIHRSCNVFANMDEEEHVKILEKGPWREIKIV
ncbi:putative het domain protein [Phaeomoniella chlamydospora]|uniref:Putative het domain protein n=1 Tax=Phaeomoniella chlamydospora TaxID=158046 RepID=A0A0G2EBW7_PHACM|nr:putative het domain protein [Phaeomoniella chlamydospora]